MSAEQQFRKALQDTGIPFTDNTTSKVLVDYVVHSQAGRPDISVEVKEKRQPINVDNWPGLLGDPDDLFIVDDLTIRKLLVCGPHAGLVVWDDITRLWYWFDLVSLAHMPRQRYNREHVKGYLKGKWVINFSNGVQCDGLGELLDELRIYSDWITSGMVIKRSACHGAYTGEVVGRGGIARTDEMKRIDYEQTR